MPYTNLTYEQRQRIAINKARALRLLYHKYGTDPYSNIGRWKRKQAWKKYKRNQWLRRISPAWRGYRRYKKKVTLKRIFKR